MKRFSINKSKDRNIFSAEVAAVTGLSLISVLGFARITNRLVRNNLNPLKTDIKVMNYLESQESKLMTKFMKMITSIASLNVLPFIAASVSYWFFKKKHNRVKSFDIPAIAIGSAILNLIFKAKFKRVRPVQDAIKVSGWSYPSGHSMVAMSFYGLMIYALFRSHLNKMIVVPAAIGLAKLIALIGISRSYLKVHYPSDVVAGYSLGFLWLLGSIGLIRGSERLLNKV